MAKRTRRIGDFEAISYYDASPPEPGYWRSLEPGDAIWTGHEWKIVVRPGRMRDANDTAELRHVSDEERQRLDGLAEYWRSLGNYGDLPEGRIRPDWDADRIRELSDELATRMRAIPRDRTPVDSVFDEQD